MPRARLTIPLVLFVAATATIAAALISLSGGQESAAAKTKRPPVILLVFDEWPLDAILRADGKIDSGRYPNIARFAGGSTWYPNATTVYDTTSGAVPAIFDGQVPTRSREPTWRGHPRNIYDLFGRAGYRIHDAETITSLCRPRLCGSRPPPPKVDTFLHRDRRQALPRLARRITGKPGRLYVTHVLLPHGPYVYLPSGKRMRQTIDDRIPEMGGGRGFHEPSLALQKQQRLRLALGLVDRQLGRLFKRLRHQGTFDRALIAVVADHGISSDVGSADRRKVTPENIDEIAPVPMFVKAPGQQRGRIDRAALRTVDLLPTLADALDIRPGYRMDGRAASARSTRARRTVRVVSRGYADSVTVSSGELARRRRALRRRDEAALGAGTWASLYRAGPRPRLIGRAVPAAPAPTGPVRAQLNDAALYGAVDASSQVLPTQLTGGVSGGLPGSRRDLAFAVNGTIRSTSTSFRLTGDPKEYFASMVPEGSLLPGVNEIAVYGLTGRRPVNLTLLGRYGGRSPR